MNWLASPPYPNETNEKNLEMEQIYRHLNYWALRLSPLLGKNVKVAIANRVGFERGF